MNPEDMAELGIAQGDLVTLSTEANDGVERHLGGLHVVSYDVPRNGIVDPECNVLVPLWHFAEGSKVPATKSIPVRINRDPVSEIVDAHEIGLTTLE